MTKRKILLICGPSGCGKSFKTQQLIETGRFFKLPQYTTRDIRHNESPFEYLFIGEEHYDVIKDKLIAKTKVRNKRYGTVPVFKDDQIGIVIVNKLGLKDFKLFAFGKDIELFVLGVDSTIPSKRSGRDEEYVQKEREELNELADAWIYNTEEKFATVEDVIDLLTEKGFLGGNE